MISAKQCILCLQTLAQLLCDMRDANKCLQFEVDDLKQKLKDAQGDIKVAFSSRLHEDRIIILR